MLTLLLLIVGNNIIINNAARILAVFPVPSISHSVVFRPITQELVKRGHEVVVLTPDPAFPKGKTPVNLTEIDFHDSAYALTKFVHESITGNPDDTVSQVEIIFTQLTNLFEMMLKSKKLQHYVFHDNKFDLMLTEGFVNQVLGISNVIKTPVIQLSSFGGWHDNFEAIGVPTHNFLYPYMTQQRQYNLSIWGKIVELYNSLKLDVTLKYIDNLQNTMLKKVLGNKTPTVQELQKNVHMLLLNFYPIWDSNRPVTTNVVYMGGIHQMPKKYLSMELKHFLDSSKNGVLYVSFGTNASPSLIAPEKIGMLLNVFSRLPYDVLFKYDKDELSGLPKNVKIAKWFPQSDLLKHPKIKAFVTQGGLQSTDEAIIAEVPLVCIPLLLDQWYNAEKYVHLGIGIKLDLTILTEEVLESSILKVIHDKSYKKNLANLNKQLHDQPQSPLDRAIWWIEHVLRHGGGSHIRSPAANISWVQYLELELVGTILVVLMAFGTVIVVSLRHILKMFGI